MAAIYFQVYDSTDLRALELLAQEVAPEARA